MPPSPTHPLRLRGLDSLHPTRAQARQTTSRTTQDPPVKDYTFFFTPAGADYYLLSERRIRGGQRLTLDKTIICREGKKSGGINLPKPFPGTKENKTLEASP